MWELSPKVRERWEGFELVASDPRGSNIYFRSGKRSILGFREFTESKGVGAGGKSNAQCLQENIWFLGTWCLKQL